MSSNVIIDMALRLHLGNDSIRPAFMQVHSGKDEFVYSSDAKTLMRVPKDLCIVPYNEVKNYPDAAKIFSQFESGAVHEFKVSELIEMFANLRICWQFRQDECSECNDGDYECPCCGNNIKCNSCEGTGEVESDEPFIWMNPKLDHQRIKIGGYKFHPKYLYRVLQTALLLMEDKIVFKLPVEHCPTKAIKAIINEGIEILVMPVNG